MPLGAWFRGNLRELFADTLLSPASLQRGYFQPAFVRAARRRAPVADDAITRSGCGSWSSSSAGISSTSTAGRNSFRFSHRPFPSARTARAALVSSNFRAYRTRGTCLAQMATCVDPRPSPDRGRHDAASSLAAPSAR